MARTTPRQLKHFTKKAAAAARVAKKVAAIPKNKDEELRMLAEAHHAKLIEIIAKTHHHCRMKSAGKTHHFDEERCLSNGHAGWCPQHKRLCHPEDGCGMCKRKKTDLIYNTRQFAWYLAELDMNAKYVGENGNWRDA